MHSLLEGVLSHTHNTHPFERAAADKRLPHLTIKRPLLAVAPDGGWLASGSRDYTVKVWEAATWQEIATLTGHTGDVFALAVAPDGGWLASGSYDDTVKVWEAATWQLSLIHI